MPNNVLGAEWGALAGLPAEEALRIVSKYASDLETRVDTRSGGELGDDDEVEAPAPNGLQVARDMKRKTLEPVAHEFVGKREAARAQAKGLVAQQGGQWSEYADYVEQVMSNTSAEQQVNPTVWAEAWWYVWGQAQRAQRNAEPATPTPPRYERDEDEESMSETRVVQGAMSAERGRGAPRRDEGKFQIADPEERRTRRKFERIGLSFSDEEWHRLQNDDSIKTYEDYQAMQDGLQRRPNGAR